MILISEGKAITVYPPKPYTTTRLIVGTFMPAVICLKSGLKQLGASPWYPFSRSPKLQLKIKEMADGGLSQVEERCLIEMGKQAGTGKLKLFNKNQPLHYNMSPSNPS